MSDPKPTVGRIVHYYDYKLSPTGGSGPFPAIVTHVHDDGRHVSLAVFSPVATSVHCAHNVADDNTPIKVGDPYWCWPPRE